MLSTICSMIPSPPVMGLMVRTPFLRNHSRSSVLPLTSKVTLAFSPMFASLRVVASFHPGPLSVMIFAPGTVSNMWNPSSGVTRLARWMSSSEVQYVNAKSPIFFTEDGRMRDSRLLQLWNVCFPTTSTSGISTFLRQVQSKKRPSLSCLNPELTVAACIPVRYLCQGAELTLFSTKGVYSELLSLLMESFRTPPSMDQVMLSLFPPVSKVIFPLFPMLSSPNTSESIPCPYRVTMLSDSLKVSNRRLPTVGGSMEVKVMDLREAQKVKAKSSMDSRPLGRTRFFSFSQLWNAWSPMDLTDSGMVMRPIL